MKKKIAFIDTLNIFNFIFRRTNAIRGNWRFNTYHYLSKTSGRKESGFYSGNPEEKSF
jgi:hypothetical protein